MDKSLLRQMMLNKRQSLSAVERTTAAASALEHAKQVLHSADNVMLYMPFRAELDPLPVAEWLLEKGKGVVVPLTDKKSRMLTPARLLHGLSSLQPAAYGILEPVAGSYLELEPTEISAVLVPGLCFDRQGFRLGYGGGYYDRFLARLSATCLTIGYAYDWQLIAEVPRESWDLPLNLIVTNKGVTHATR